MNIIMGGRRTGKTARLVRLSADYGYYMVVRDRKTACMVMGMAAEMGKTIPTPITYMEFRDCLYYGRGINGFLIDNADALLQYMSGVPIRAITMTYGEEG